MDHVKAISVIIGYFFLISVAFADKTSLNWTQDALALQRQIDIDAPFSDATFIGTHNSYNSESYRLDLRRYIDPNHTLSVTEQLNLGIRSIEYDAHWFPHGGGKRDILLCHGLNNHLGCSRFDRPIIEGLIELKDWLKANPKEIILLYIEKHVDDHEELLASYLENILGNYIYKPSDVTPSINCQAIPQQLTKNKILAANKQLIIVTKGCALNVAWRKIVFAGIGEINEDPSSFLDSTIGEDFLPFPDCSKSTIFRKDPLHTSLWRIFEDRTRLSNVPKAGRKLLVEDIKEALRCDINWPSMDMLEYNDPRLSAAVWSWATNFPTKDGGDCAVASESGIKNHHCYQSSLGYACQDDSTKIFSVVTLPGLFEQGENICQRLGSTWHFKVPINASYMHQLKQSLLTQHLPEVWVNYAKVNNNWQVNS